MGKREYGSGSITERGKNTFMLRVISGIDPLTGQRRRVHETFHGSRREAQMRLAEMLVECGGGKNVPSDQNLEQMIQRWREVKHHAAGTVRSYDNALRHVPHHMMRSTASKITTEDIDRLYGALLKNGASIHTVRTLHAALGAAFNQAVRWGHLDRNPVSGANCPPKPGRVIRLPSDAALERLMSLVADDPMMLLWMRLLMAAGIRRAESLGLRWSDVDFERSELSIVRSISVDGVNVIPTKGNRERIVALDADTILLFANWRRIQYSDGVLVEDPWIFSPSADGATPFRADTMYKRFVKLAQRAGVKTSPHKMRHLMISKAMDAGMSPREIADRAGHSRASLTLDIYSQRVTEADRRLANAVGSMMPLPKRK